MTPELSILVLTYNRLEMSSTYIPGIIKNVGDIPFEVLIWDNGSDDGSYDWAYSYGNSDSRVYRVYGSSENIGMEAFNTMASDARGKYILKVDDDIIVPANFGSRIVEAYRKINESKLLFLGWDMSWTGTGTFATRSGFSMYQGNYGKIIQLSSSERVLLCYNPDRWMVNGVCRLSTKEDFLKIGGHPKGVIYGVDAQVSCAAAQYGYWVGYLNSPDLVHHKGRSDTVDYRKLKNTEMHKIVREKNAKSGC